MKWNSSRSGKGNKINIDCYPKSRLAGTLFCGGVPMPHSIDGNSKLQEAYELGKNV